MIGRKLVVGLVVVTFVVATGKAATFTTLDVSGLPPDETEASYDPFNGKTCGDSCTLCCPNGGTCSETPVLKQCTALGVCRAGQSSAGSVCQKKATIVLAHCDDEAFLMGTIAFLVDQGWKVDLVLTVTADPQRREETIRGMQVVGVPRSQIHFLGLDPIANNADLLIEKLAPILSKLDPDILFSFGPDGVYGHTDHRAVSFATMELVNTTLNTPVYLQIAISREKNASGGGRFTRGRAPVKDSAINLRVDVRPYRSLIVRACLQYPLVYTPETCKWLGDALSRYGYEDFVLGRIKCNLNRSVRSLEDILRLADPHHALPPRCKTGERKK